MKRRTRRPPSPVEISREEARNSPTPLNAPGGRRRSEWELALRKRVEEVVAERVANPIVMQLPKIKSCAAVLRKDVATDTDAEPPAFELHPQFQSAAEFAEHVKTQLVIVDLATLGKMDLGEPAEFLRHIYRELEACCVPEICPTRPEAASVKTFGDVEDELLRLANWARKRGDERWPPSDGSVTGSDSKALGGKCIDKQMPASLQGTIPGEPEKTKVLDKNSIQILRALRDAKPSTLTQEGLERIISPSLSTRTIQRRLQALRNDGLTNRPLGPKKGETITENGLKMIECV